MSESAVVWGMVLVAGALIGSFLNVVIHRGPAMWGLIDDNDASRGSFIQPRSYCPACRKPIPAWRLIPIVSYALQRGCCAECGARIPVRYPLVEIMGALAAGAAFSLFGLTLAAIFATLFGWFLIALAVIDWEIGYLPNWLTLPLVPLGLIANGFGAFATLSDALIGAVAGYLVFRLIAEAFIRLRGYEGLGQGDAKLLAAIGAWGGWSALPLVIFAASVLTLIAALFLRLAHKNVTPKTALAFGPGLCVAGYCAVMFFPQGV